MSKNLIRQIGWYGVKIVVGSALALLLLVTAFAARPAYAATITVDGTTCTLANAITAANTDTATGGCPAGSGADTIEVTVDVTLTSALPQISSEIILNGNGHTIVRDPAAPEFRILDLSGAKLTLNRATIAGGFAGIMGGGIRVENGSTLVVNDSTIRDNEAKDAGSAITAGILSGGNTVTINNSTIRNNTTGVRSVVTVECSTGKGGGRLTINNSTISGNTSTGGAVTLVRGFGTQQCEGTIDSSTITNNTATGSGGDAGLNVFGAIMTVRNSIIAGQANGTDCRYSGGTLNSSGHNISSDASCNFTQPSDQQNVSAADLRLGPLADNGGDTWTHALLPGSVAIDAGATSLTTDQRGIARPQGTVKDIGAYEWQTGEGACVYTNPTTASTEAELNAAILCFSRQTIPGTYQLNLGADINLTAGTTEIRNPTSGVVLALDGGGHTVNGQDIPGVRPFAVAPATTASMNDLTVSGGRGIGRQFGGGILNRGVLTVSNSTISGNTAGSGGGIYNLAYNFAAALTVSNSTISGNTAGDGGGILNDAATLTVTNSTIDANTTSGGGGGIFDGRAGSVTITDSTISDNRAKDGGGIHVGNDDLQSSPGAFTVERSTISGNTATGNGGGIELRINAGQVTIANSTFSGNTAGSQGGGIHNLNVFGPTVQIVSSTFSGNTAASGGGLNAQASTAVANTIIANSTGGGDCVGTATGSHNLVKDAASACGLTDGVSGNIIGVDPKLGPLADNGGPTQTHAPLPGSWALDTGDTTLPTDQRSEARPFGLADDIGAYESQDNGTIIIAKQTAPVNAGDFDFTHNITTTTTFTLAGGQSETFLNVAPGTYTVTEAVEPLWRLVDLRCDDEKSPRPSSGSTITRTATIEVEPGETVTCTFSNSEDDIIFVQKLTTPAGGTGFDFELGGDATDSFSLDGGGVQALDVISGTYTITETDPGPDYTLVDIECTVFGPGANDESHVSGDLTSGSVTLTLTDNGQAAFCRFENEKVGTITVVKEANPSDNTGFDFTLRGDASQDFTLRDPNTAAITFTLPSGSYEITEVNLPSGWGNYNVFCRSGDSKTGVDGVALTAFIDLVPGDAVTCTYRNAKHGNITIKKDAAPADDTVFNFTISDGGTTDPFTLQDPSNPEELFPDLAAGVYYIAEAPQAGWTLDDITCDSTSGASTFDYDENAGTLEIDLAPDDDVTCTFVNEKHGTVTIEKSADPADDTKFTFVVASANAGVPFVLQDPIDATRTITDVPPGRYGFGEFPTAGWALTDIKCTSTLSSSVFTKTLEFGGVTFDLAPGDDVSCTFENKKRGSITIVKDADPADNTPFDFGISGGPSTELLNEAFILRDPLTTTKTFTNVVPGTYAIGEDLLADWNLTAINCDSTLGTSSQDDNLSLGGTNLALASGDDVTCTFVNQAKRGTIIIEKTSVPAGATGFSFSGDLSSFILNGGEKKSFSDVAPGTFIVTEATPPSPFKLSGLVCSDSNPNGTASTWDVASATATINLDPGETVRCRFTNTAANSVTVEKITIPSTSDSFGFTGTLGSFNLSDGGIQTYADVPAGQITISENDPAPAGYKLTDITCTDATGQSFTGNLSNRSVTLDLTQGNSLHCAFTNTQLGTVIIRKATAPAGGSGFSFGGDLGSFTLKDKGKEVIANVEPGTYAVSEDDPTATGFELSGISCVDSVKGGKRSTGNVGTATATINLDPGETVTCTFTNSQEDTISVEKVTVPDSTTTFGFDGGSLGTFNVAGGSVQDFTGLTAGQYTITEDDPAAAGYRLTKIECVDSVTGTVFPGNAISRTVTMDLTAGERVHCTFTNEKIFGDPAVRITESYLVSRVEEGKISGDGSQACYWLTLASYTGVGDVTVSIGQPANGQVTVNKSTVVLNSSNWNNLSLTDRSNFVCIRPVDDKVADGGAQICRDGNSDMVGNGSEVTDKECGDHTDTIPHSITGATAPGYSTSTPFERLKPDGKQTVTDNTVPVLIQDNDAGGVVLTESYGVSDLDEDGTPVHQACYWVTLTSQPTAAVTVTPQPNGQVSVQPSSLVLNGSNWDALGSDGNKICIRPVQDNAVEGTTNQYCADKKVDLYGAGAVDTQVCGSHLGAVAHSFSSSDANYNGAGVPVSGNGPDLGNNGAGTIDVLIRDDESARLIFTPAAINALEGGVVQYTVRLSSQPTGNVSVAAQTSSVSAAGVDATALTFTPADWNVAQTLSVTLPDDNDVNGIRTGSISHGVNSGDVHYNGLSGAPVTLPLTITDDDSASAALSRGSVAVAEGGAGDTYAVRLTMQPTADVVVTVNGGGQVTANPSQLTFTPGNWNVEQSVSIAAIDDAVDEGDVSSATIGHTASSSDPAYNGAAIATVLAEVTDNDTAALAVGQAAASIAEGASTSYGVALATQPAGPVQVFVVTDGKTSANPVVLTFDASNWNVAQTVTLTGADDDVDNAADVRTSLVTHAAVSGDGAYNGVNDESLRVDVVDNDVAAIRFSESNVRVAKDGQASYSVTLATRPLAPVVVDLAPSSGVTVDASCAAASEGVSQCLVFTPENWNVAQSLTLTALTDAPEHIDHLGLSADEGYNGLNARLQVNGVGAPENPVFLPLVVKR